MLTSINKFFTSVRLSIESEAGLVGSARSLFDGQPANVDGPSDLAPSRTFSLASFGRVEKISSSETSAEQELDAGGLARVVSPFFGKGQTRNKMRMNRRKGANVGAEK